MTVAVSSDVPAEAEPYLEAVRSLVGAVPEDDRAEFLDDTAAQLRELVAEVGTSLHERLGDPDAYARELLTSAGYGTSELGRSARWAERALRTWRSSEQLRLVRETIPEVRPGWWVVRPVLLTVGALVVLGDGRRVDDPFGLLVAGVVAVLLMPTSIRWGQRGRRERSWLDRAVTVAAVVAALVAMNAVASLPRHHFTDVSASWMPGSLTHGDGTPITNVFAYDTEGRPVEVFLYDQAGRPISDLAESDERGSVHARFVFDRNGQPILNLYPREQERFGPHGSGTARPPSVIVPEVAPAETSTTITTSTTSSPPPSAG